MSLTTKLARLVKGNFGRNVVWMTGSTVVAHGLFLAASPILTRMYSPEAFAQLGILTTLQALLLSGMSARIEWSVPTAGSQNRAAALVAAALVTLLGTSVLLTAGAWIFMDRIAAAFDLSDAVHLLLLALPLSTIAGGIQMVVHSWCVSTGKLRPVALSKFLQSAVFVGVALIMGAFTSALIWLPFGFLIGHIVASIAILALSIDMVRRLRKLRRRFMLAVVRSAGGEIMSSLGSSLLHNFAFYLPFLMIWVWYDETALGWFAFVFRIGTAPLGFLSAALAKSFWAEAADLAKRDPAHLRWFFLKTTRILAMVAVPFTLVCLAAPLYFAPIFGTEWDGAGDIMAALTPMLVSLLVFSSTNHLIVYRRQHWQLWSDAVSVILFGGVFVTLAQAGTGVTLTLAVASCAFLASYGLRFWLHLHANRLWSEETAR